MSMFRNVLVSALCLAPLRATYLAAQGNTTREVHVAALKWVIDSVVLQHPKSLAAICISSGQLRQLNGRPAPLTADGNLDSLTIAAIPRAAVPVRAGSACTISTTSPMPTIEQTTKREAATVIIGPVVMDSAGYASVQTEYRLNGRWGTGFSCKVVKRAEVWAMAGCTVMWQS